MISKCTSQQRNKFTEPSEWDMLFFTKVEWGRHFCLRSRLGGTLRCMG